jgi:hypothetical protein
MLKKIIKMKELKNDYKTPIKKILAGSSLAYLLSPFRSKRFLIKIIWSLFLVLFLFGSIYYVILNILDYLKYDTTTSIQTIYEQESEFPTISICSRIDSNFEIKIIDFWFNSIEQSIDKDLQSYNDSSFGKCYRFNSGTTNKNETIFIKKSRKSGFDDGFFLSFYSNTTFDYGRFFISIHNYTQIPRTIYNKGYFISSGSNNYFIIKRIFDQKLEQPYNSCLNDRSKFEFNQTIIEYLKKINHDYTQKECINICRNLKYNHTNACGCYLDSLQDDIFTKCYYNTNNLRLKACVDKFMGNFNVGLCYLEYCPLECDSFEYDITFYAESILSAGIISPDNKDLFKDFKTYENVSKTFFSISVYYKDLKYTLISQQPKIELFDLVSNLGGILGLFIGFTFISLLEIIEILAEFIYVYFD